MESIITPPEEVCKAVSLDLRKRGITHEEAGKMIGKSRVSVSNLLYRKKYFSRNAAILFSDTFGHNKEFLTRGLGELVPSQTKSETKVIEWKWNKDPNSLLCVIEVLENLLSISDNTELLNAWKCFKNRDLDGFLEHLRFVENSTGVKFTVPIAIVNLVMAQSRVVK